MTFTAIKPARFNIAQFWNHYVAKTIGQRGFRRQKRNHFLIVGFDADRLPNGRWKVVMSVKPRHPHAIDIERKIGRPLYKSVNMPRGFKEVADAQTPVRGYSEWTITVAPTPSAPSPKSRPAPRRR